MTLSRRLLLKTIVLIAALLLIAAASLSGLAGLDRSVTAAGGAYQRLRSSYEVGFKVLQARAALLAQPDHPDRAAAHLIAARMALARLLDDPAADQSTAELRQAVLAAQSRLDAAMAALANIKDASAAQAQVHVLDSAMNAIGQIVQQTGRDIHHIQQRANQRRRNTTLWLGLLAAATALFAVAIGVWEYRTLMRPLRKLGRSVQQLAQGDFSQRLDTDGDVEFATLARQFNRMAEELDSLYRDLEAKVRAKSRELAQAERLASVGYLAAGVAHEINNPLSIIAGHAELTLRQLQREQTAGEPSLTADLHEPLAIIRDEAFRCKTITDKLLSLASPRGNSRGNAGGTSGGDTLRSGGAPRLNEGTSGDSGVSGGTSGGVPGVVAEVVQLVRTLRQGDERQIIVEPDNRKGDAETLQVRMDPAQLKQVLLNLLVNALEATSAGDGIVRIRWGRGTTPVDAAALPGPLPGADERWVWLTVSDNGRGMSPQTLERVFEPFFSDKRGSGQPGTGLGLSISYAIVQEQGGQLSAASDGPGHGSCFTLRLRNV